MISTSPGRTSTFRGDVSTLDQVLQANAVGLAAFLASHEHRVVAVREIGQATDLNHHVQQRHALPVRDRLGLRRFADDADLLAARTLERRDDDRDDRVPGVLAQGLLDVARQIRRVTADRLQILESKGVEISCRRVALEPSATVRGCARR